MAEMLEENQEPNTNDEEIIVCEGTTTIKVDASPTVEDGDESKSALRDNIARKGKSAYYYAHAHKATGPKWDGKPQPRLLSRESSSGVTANSGSRSKELGFEYHKSNITNYAFLDERDDKRRVRIYVNLPGVGECCTNDNDVRLEYTERSLCLTVSNYNPSLDDELEQAAAESKGEDRCLSFGMLYGEIEKATFRKKADKITLTLVKKDEDVWTSVTA